MVTLRYWGHSERESLSDFHSHKMNANIVSIYNRKTAYLRAEQNNRLFCLGRVYDLDFGLHKSSCLKIKTTKIYRAPIVSPKLQLMRGDWVGIEITVQ